MKRKAGTTEKLVYHPVFKKRLGWPISSAQTESFQDIKGLDEKMKK